MKKILKSIVVWILMAEASILLQRHKPTIIAITGSVGKTSAKDAIFAAIKNNISARKSEKSYNSDIGVSLTVLGLPNGWTNPLLWLRNIIDGFFIALFSRTYPDVLILETGIDRPNDMEKLTKWLKPNVVVLTSLPNVPVHVEYFDSPSAIVSEKMKLVTALKTDGVLIYNHDDSLIQAQLSDVLQKQVGFGRYLETDFTAREDQIVYKDDHPSGMKFVLLHDNKTYEIAITGTIGAHHLYSCCAAIAVADQLNIPIDDAINSLKKLETPNGRMRLLSGIKGTILIDDTYNSSPIAVEQALQALNELKYVKRKIVVLGDMLELGKYSSDEHKRIGGLVAGVADVLFTVGIRARHIAEGALINGMNEESIYQYEDSARAGRELQAILKTGDVVLIKGSQSIRAEKIVEEVMLEPNEAEKLLVRQDKNWQRK